MTRLLVLDFDGTMTDAEAEGAPYRQGYLEDIAAMCGLDHDEVHALAARFEAQIAAAPEAHGWIFDGAIVAPATVDPYLRVMPVARRILDHAGVLLDERDRARLLDGILYKYNYQKTRDVPWPDTGGVLRALAGRPVYVVTNSHTEAVQKKVRALGGLDWLVDRVHGRARKYAIDNDFSAVPLSMSLPGLGRPVLLRRRLYCEVIEALRAEVGADWSDVAVVGDIFELDLALPLAMGARVGLMVNRFTPPWEKAFIDAHPRGVLLGTVADIPGFVGW